MQDDNIEEDHKEKSSEFNEPVAAYRKLNLKFYNSFEEQQKDMYKYWASITPVQRMAHLLEMIMVCYGLSDENQKNPRINNKIKIFRS